MTRFNFWLTTVMGSLAIVLAIANAALFTSNRAMQGELNGRAQYVQQSAQLEGLFNDMVRALADLSVRNNDAQLKALLENAGITITLNNPPTAPAPAKK